MNKLEFDNLPSLIYIGDVPIESSYHGSFLLYRLLQQYPHDRLSIIEGDIVTSELERRLPGICYAALHVGNRRLLHSRLSAWYSSWLILTASSRLRRIKALLNGFQPEAVLTVAHGYSWITAAKFSIVYGLPLHLICHDDWIRSANVIGIGKKYLEETFGAVYRRAVSRFCISPSMCETYYRFYGSKGTVLYPSRAMDCPKFDTPPERSTRNNHPFSVAFGGTINSPGYVRALKTLALVLESLGGRLLIFGPLTTKDACKAGLTCQNIILRGLVTSAELITRFREEVDVLFVPMSFDLSDRSNMESSFPSKLTDYTAVGLPLLVYGPAYCSAVRWAKENPGVATVVEEEDREALAVAIRNLAEEPPIRVALGERALEVGRRYFAYEAAQRIFYLGLEKQKNPTD